MKKEYRVRLNDDESSRKSARKIEADSYREDGSFVNFFEKDAFGNEELVASFNKMSITYIVFVGFVEPINLFKPYE